MINENNIDYLSFYSNLKNNAVKGVNLFKTLLANGLQANKFALNAGGVTVVLGTPVGEDDYTSGTLRNLLLNSSVAGLAINTWLASTFNAETFDVAMQSSANRNRYYSEAIFQRVWSKMAEKDMLILSCNQLGLNPDLFPTFSSLLSMYGIQFLQESHLMACVYPYISNQASFWNSVFASSTQLATIVGNSSLSTVVFANSTAVGIIVASTSLLYEFASHLPSFTAGAGTLAFIKAVLLNQASTTYVVSNRSFRDKLLASSVLSSAATAVWTAQTVTANKSTPTKHIAFGLVTSGYVSCSSSYGATGTISNVYVSGSDSLVTKSLSTGMSRTDWTGMPFLVSISSGSDIVYSSQASGTSSSYVHTCTCYIARYTS